MSDTFNVLLLGAGPVNFGTTEGPWNHVSRYYHILSELTLVQTTWTVSFVYRYVSAKLTSRILGDRLNVVGVVERDQERGERVLSLKRADSKAGYSNTKIFSSLDEAGSALSAANNLPKWVIPFEVRCDLMSLDSWLMVFNLSWEVPLNRDGISRCSW